MRYPAAAPAFSGGVIPTSPNEGSTSTEPAHRGRHRRRLRWAGPAVRLTRPRAHIQSALSQPLPQASTLWTIASAVAIGERDYFYPAFASGVSNALLQRHTPEARQILRQLLVGRLVFTPKRDETGRYCEFVGQGSISDFVCGAVLPKEWWRHQRDPIELTELKYAISLRAERCSPRLPAQADSNRQVTRCLVPKKSTRLKHAPCFEARTGRFSA